MARRKATKQTINTNIDMELVRDLMHDFRFVLAVPVDQWLKRMRANGVDECAIRVAAASEVMAMARCLHVGSADLFLRMAAAAAEAAPTEH